VEQNPFAEELRRRGRKTSQELAQEPSVEFGRGALGTFGELAVTNFVNEFVLGLPSASGDMIAAAGSGLSMLKPGDQTFSEEYAKQQNQFPANALRAIPSPTVQEISAAGQSLGALVPGGESFSDSFDQSLAEINANHAQMRADHPIASFAADIVPDAAGLLLFRRPFAKKINDAETAFMNPQILSRRQQIQQSLGNTVAKPIKEEETLWAIQKAFQSNTVRSLARGAGRSLETGLEAVALDILKGDDPLETAGMAAGGQLLGSAILGGPAKPLLTGSLGARSTKLVVAGAVTAGLMQMLSSATPGGNNFSLPNIEAGFAKTTLTMGLGALMAMVGGGRGRGGEFAKNAPRLMDAIATIPRGATLSLLEEYQNRSDGEQQRAQTILLGMANDHMHFGENFTRRLERSVRTGSTMREIDRMMENEDFRSRVAALEPAQ
jgi:hypothetical protein